MKIEQVALQLFTMRERMKTREDLEATLKRVKEIGYPAVQISGLNWDIISEEDMVALCAEIGLVICATHESAQTILQDPAKVVERLSKLGCKYTAYPHPAGVDFGDPAQVQELIAGLDASGKVLADAGQVLCYHNHGMEFRKSEGKIILEKIYDETNPAYLQGEPDTYWVQVGGGNPTGWCERLSGRLPLIHLKDYGTDAENKVHFCEIGNGVLDFPGIIAAAETAGCEWFIVEQDKCPGDEFVSIKQSFDFIAANLVG